mmetsp:Transcript_24880/g.41211  ORF Transcript_24880/g.41211 Transcript_24880/m.41211 type:complete len:215 (+) Transcript_24880:1149-1793(+)
MAGIALRDKLVGSTLSSSSFFGAADATEASKSGRPLMMLDESKPLPPDKPSSSSSFGADVTKRASDATDSLSSSSKSGALSTIMIRSFCSRLTVRSVILCTSSTIFERIAFESLVSADSRLQLSMYSSICLSLNWRRCLVLLLLLGGPFDGAAASFWRSRQFLVLSANRLFFSVFFSSTNTCCLAMASPSAFAFLRVSRLASLSFSFERGIVKY